jgi:hypothetical protein
MGWEQMLRTRQESFWSSLRKANVQGATVVTATTGQAQKLRERAAEKGLTNLIIMAADPALVGHNIQELVIDHMDRLIVVADNELKEERRGCQCRHCTT